MEDSIRVEISTKLKLVKYPIVFHLLLFSVLSFLAAADGQQFKIWWGLHLGVCTSLVIHIGKKEQRQFNTLIFYCIAMAGTMIYKFYHANQSYDIETIYFFLYGMLILSLLFSASLIWATKKHFIEGDGGA